MKASLLGAGLLWLLATGCGPHQPTTEAPVATQPATAPVVAPTLPQPLARQAPVQPPASLLYGSLSAAADTLLRLPGHTYRLSWRVRLDTLQPLTHSTPPDPARHFPGDTSRGFQGYYQVEVRDSLGQRVGNHTFTKADFYPAVGPELAIGSAAQLPQLLGYSAPLGGLVFTVPFNMPDTDWYGEAALVLAPSGQVRYLGLGTEGGPEVEVTLAADGRTLLTGAQIRNAGRPPVLLARAGAELRGAQLLNDTLALLLYEPGQSRIHPDGTFYLDATRAQQRQPNAFVRDVRTGRDVSRFRYDGFYEELGYIVPAQLVAPAKALYLLDADKGLYVLPLRPPAGGRLLPFAHLPRAASPTPAAGEVSVDLQGPTQRYRFLVDTAQPTRVRYHLLKD